VCVFFFQAIARINKNGQRVAPVLDVHGAETQQQQFVLEIHRPEHEFDVCELQHSRGRFEWERGWVFLGERGLGVREQSRENIEEDFPERRQRRQQQQQQQRE
jgi:predicted esterase